MIPTTRIFPFVFILLWSSAFIAARYGTLDAGPFSYLLTRFILVALLFGLIALAMRAALPPRGSMPAVIITGVLMHGVYLGGIFFAISRGMPAGLAALIGGMQPLLTTLMARGFLGEDVSRRQYCGIVCGMAGVALVIIPRLDPAATLADGTLTFGTVLAPVIGVIALSLATVIQKKTSAPGPEGAMNLLGGNFIQALAAAGFYALPVMLFEPYRLEWTAPVTLSMIWVVLAVSLGAISILMVLIREGRMASVSSLFFMTPPVAAVMGYFAFGETLGAYGIAGFALASAGVWLASRAAASDSERGRAQLR